MPRHQRDAERLQQPMSPMPSLIKGQQVEVYLGAGWAKGSVQHCDRSSVSVWLPQQRRSPVCKDARNIRKIT